MSSDDKTHENQMIQRGIKKPSPIGTGLFLGLRTLDPLLQYAFLGRGVGISLLHKAGLQTLSQGPPILTSTLIDHLELSPYRLVLLAMAAGSAIKQNYWLLSISQEVFPIGSALEVSVFNTVVNSLNSALFVCSLTSASMNGEHFPQTPLIVGSILYAIGIVAETFSEWQRKKFKQSPSSKGQVYEGGLFGLARHINYGGYTLWRTGYALAAGGWIWGAIVGSFFAWNFASNSIPELDSYCTKRYGEKWEAYKKRTPFKLLPYIY